MEPFSASEGLPINLGDLLNRRTVEGNRVEFKASWTPPVKVAVLKTACAFANDLLNLNGGYIVLGVEERGGEPILPPRGLDEENVDALQRELRGLCRTRIQPEYQPILFPATYGEHRILVIWAPGGDNRPYQLVGHDDPGFYVRQGSESLHARGELLRQLMEVAAKVPFDDRRNHEARIEDISPMLVRRFLHDVRSSLAEADGVDDAQIYRRLRIVTPVNAHEVPRNVALMFFHENPDRFFPGARIEVVQFGDDAGGDLIEERVFGGPLPSQIREALGYLNSLGGTLVQKVRGQAEAERTVPYPYEAMEEALVNAIYHRSYELPREPVKVYLYPDRLEIYSYPGPVAGIQQEHFALGRVPPAVPARNRRVGDFLKDLRLAEARGTGIPSIQRRMSQNGSPPPTFEFDEQRTYFRVILPVHPRYEIIQALRETAHLWAIGERTAAMDHLRRVFERQPGSGALAGQIIVYAAALEVDDLARQTFATFEGQPNRSDTSRPYLAMAEALLNEGLSKEAVAVLKRTPPAQSVDDNVAAAILHKRAGDLSLAHTLFAQAYAVRDGDPKSIQEFAQTKLGLARGLKGNDPAKRRLNTEAAELLRRAIQLSDDPVRQAWCWFDLARTLDWLRSPRSDVQVAFERARALLPEETRFEQAYLTWRNRADRR